MKPGVTVTKDDTAKVLASIRAMSREKVLVGVPAPNARRRNEDGKYLDPIDNAALGYVHENGSPRAHIPPRPFLIPGVRYAAPKFLPVLRAAAQEGFRDGNAVHVGLARAGLVAVSTVKQYLKSLALNGAAQLAESTLKARKRQGFQGESPLIRTGQLLNSLTFVVRKK